MSTVSDFKNNFIAFSSIFVVNRLTLQDKETIYTKSRVASMPRLHIQQRLAPLLSHPSSLYTINCTYNIMIVK